MKSLLDHLEERLWKAAPEARPVAHLELVRALVFACRRGAELGRRLRDACTVAGSRGDPRRARLLATLRGLADELQRDRPGGSEALRELELLLDQMEADSAAARRPGI